MCKCQALMDEHLKDKGVQLSVGFFLDGNMLKGRLIVKTTALPGVSATKAKKAPVVNGIYCTFCGEKDGLNNG